MSTNLDSNKNQPKNQMVFTALNYKIFAAAVAVVVIGFLLMIGGASTSPNEFHENEIFSPIRISLAPIIIIAGFILGIVSIMIKPKPKK